MKAKSMHKNSKSMQKVNLFIGAHPDDIELHCAGTILKLIESGERCKAVVATQGELRAGDRAEEQRKSFKALGITGIFFNGKDGGIKQTLETQSVIDNLLATIKPARVFVHCPTDVHLDHQNLSKMILVAHRHKDFDLYYYPPTDTIAPFDANVYVDIGKYVSRKAEVLAMFASQKDRLQERAWREETSFAYCVEKFQLVFKREL